MAEHVSKPISALINNLAEELFNMGREEAWDKGVCVKCKQPALPNCYSQAGIKEYKMSALCEKCYDEITGGDK